MSWTNKINKEIREKIKEKIIKQSTLEEEQLQELEDKVLEFYNNPQKDIDVFTLDDGSVICYIFTQEGIPKLDKEGNQIYITKKNGKKRPAYQNEPQKQTNRQFGNKTTYWNFVNMMIGGEPKSAIINATSDLWNEIGIFNSEAFVKANKLKKTYKLLIDTANKKIKAKPEMEFIKYVNSKWAKEAMENDEDFEPIESLEQLDEESDYRTYYAINAQQVIK